MNKRNSKIILMIDSVILFLVSITIFLRFRLDVDYSLVEGGWKFGDTLSVVYGIINSVALIFIPFTIIIFIVNSRKKLVSDLIEYVKQVKKPLLFAPIIIAVARVAILFITPYYIEITRSIGRVFYIQLFTDTFFGLFSVIYMIMICYVSNDIFQDSKTKLKGVLLILLILVLSQFKIFEYASIMSYIPIVINSTIVIYFIREDKPVISSYWISVSMISYFIIRATLDTIIIFL